MSGCCVIFDGSRSRSGASTARASLVRRRFPAGSLAPGHATRSRCERSYRTDASTIRRGLWKDAVANRLNPALTLVAGAISANARVPVEPILDAGTLAPLSSDVTQCFEASTSPAYSVVFVAIESLRSDVVLLRHQGREITPNLNRFARLGLHFRRAYTQSTHSDYADMCIVSSLYPLPKYVASLLFA